MKTPTLSYEDALGQLLGAARPLDGAETLGLFEAHRRILAEPIVARCNVPPHDNSAMDGYALRRGDVAVAGTRLTVSQRIPAGTEGAPLVPQTAARIFTGAPIPDGADAVVMQERTHALDDAVVIDEVPRAGQNIRRAGEDIAEGDVVLASGKRLDAAALGLVASIGIPSVVVRRRLKVACFFTGDELVMPGEPLPPGAIYNSNRFVLRALLEGMDCEVRDLGIVQDTLEATRIALRDAAASADVVLTSGGVSVGEEDHVKAAVEAEGRLALWKIAIKPGKPLAFGRIGGADFVGLPGNPVSAFVTFLTLVRPFLLARQGVAQPQLPVRRMEAAFDWPRIDPRREFLRVSIAADGRLALFPRQGSGVLSSCAAADGLVDNPPGQAIRAGDAVDFISFAELGLRS